MASFNKFKYPERPETLPGGAPLAPVASNPDLVEASLPGDLAHVTETHHICLAIEPTTLGGAVYWSGRAGDQAKRPVLLIDYLPKTEAK